MNSPEPEDDAFLRRVAHLPPPTLRDTARQRSLEAALAAALSPSPLPSLSPSPPPPRVRRFPVQWSALAACWALAAYFRLSAPGAPENPGTSPAAGYSAWPGPFHPDADAETTKLLADLYPARNWNIE
jgi:hypothetical protein